VTVRPYEISHAQSIAVDLFDGLDTEIIIQQREDLLSPGPEEVYSVCCLSEDRVVGVCTGVRNRWFGERHRIEMVQVVVQDGFRGLGIARLMMREIVRHFSKIGVEIVQISVEESNTPALTAYQRIGFIKYGLFPNGLKHDSEYSNEILMAMTIEELLEDGKA